MVRGGSCAVEVDIPLELPDRSARKIAKLTGTMEALIPGRVETFEFAELKDAKNVEIRRGGVVVILQMVRKNVETHEVRVLVRFDEASGALESHRAGWVYDNEAYLIGPDGKRVQQATFEGTRQAANAVALAYIFVPEKEIGQYKFIYKTPAALVKMPIPFELKDIDLP